MAKTRKLVTKDFSEPSFITDDESVPEPVDDEVEPPPPKSTVRARKSVTVILQEATSLTVAGMKFTRNVPTEIPIEHAKLFREHGWFRVV